MPRRSGRTRRVRPKKPEPEGQADSRDPLPEPNPAPSPDRSVPADLPAKETIRGPLRVYRPDDPTEEPDPNVPQGWDYSTDPIPEPDRQLPAEEPTDPQQTAQDEAEQGKAIEPDQITNMTNGPAVQQRARCGAPYPDDFQLGLMYQWPCGYPTGVPVSTRVDEGRHQPCPNCGG